MIRFKENPDLKLKRVKTIKGLIEYKRNCVSVDDVWYVKGEDCIDIDGKWYPKTSKLIALDHETGEWVLIKGKPLVYGVVGFKTDGSAILGYFTENKYNNVVVRVPQYGDVRTFNEKLLVESGFVEEISTGTWVNKRDLTDRDMKRITAIGGRRVHTNKGYNIEDNADEFKQKIDAYANYNIPTTPGAIRFGKLLGEVTYGAEIETSMGTLPDHVQNRTGVVICRDGSIKNAEFVTVPMKGPKGLLNLKYLSSELSKRTLTDIDCSLHFHLGNLPKDRLFIVSLYALAIRIQNEVFSMFPRYKQDWQNIKRQDYNQKLRKIGIGLLKPTMKKEEYTQYIDEAYYRIATWLNDGVPPDNNFNRVTNEHQQTQKWNRKQRYYWINFMNMFFSKRRTMEFRLHHNTVNGQKMVNWLFICNAICQYAAQNSDEILSSDKPIPLDTVLDYYGQTFKSSHAKFLSEYLKAYVKDRKEYFLKDYKNGDFISQKETNEDKDYVFKYEGISWLF